MPSSFAAGPQALGYLYQVRHALLTLLQAKRDDLSVSIERLDDIDVSGADGPLTLAQLKHHIGRPASLTDTSKDLWKTLRVWSEELSTGKWDPDSVELQLVTTASAPVNSAAWFLRPGAERDPSRAADLLLSAAAASQSQDSAMKNSFAAFNGLGDPDRARLLGSMKIFDGAPDVLDLKQEIKLAIRIAAPPGEPALHDRVYNELEGWWFDRAVEHLVDASATPIPLAVVRQKLWDITADLKPSRLPISYAEAEPDYLIDPDSDPRLFVRQLRLLGVHVDRVRRAILDYYRAFEQRTDWLDLHLLIDDELKGYERRLIDAWMGLKLRLEDEMLPDGAKEEDCVRVGRRLLGWVESEASIPIRADVVDGFVMRGSFHILANRKKQPHVYWHPKFAERMSTLLS